MPLGQRATPGSGIPELPFGSLLANAGRNIRFCRLIPAGLNFFPQPENNEAREETKRLINENENEEWKRQGIFLIIRCGRMRWSIG
jgi:hypothetical protein